MKFEIICEGAHANETSSSERRQVNETECNQINPGTLGTQVLFSPLRYFANSWASSLISVSRVWCSPFLIRLTSTIDSKNPLRSSRRIDVSESVRYSRLPFFPWLADSVFILKSFLLIF